MKKIKSFSMLLVMAMVLTMMSMPVQAAAKKSAVQKKADAVTKELTSYANYYGWEMATNKVTKKSGTQVKKSLKMQTTSGTYFSYTQVTKKSGKKYSTYFTSKGKKFKLSEVKSGLKRYSSSKAVKNFLKARAEKQAKSLSSYAKARKWNVSQKTSASTKKATTTLNFSNKKVKFTATVTVTRNKKSPKVSFTRKGKKSSAKAIKAWLEQYKDKDSEKPTDNEDNSKPDDNKDAVTDAELIKLASDKMAELTKVGQEKNWTMATTGTGTKVLTTVFANSEWKFTVIVRAENNSGKAKLSYMLQNKASDKDTIVSWLTKYALAPNPSDGSPIDPDGPIKPTQAEMVALAKTESDTVQAVAKAKQWTLTDNTGAGTTEIKLQFENSKYKIRVGLKATERRTVTYTLMDKESSKEEILGWFTTYAADPITNGGTTPPSPSPSPSPSPGPNPEPEVKPLTTEQLTKAARTAMDELVVESIKFDWTTTETINGGTRIQTLFENASYNFRIDVEAKDVGKGTAEITYTFAGKTTSTITREAAIKCFEQYKAAAKPSDNNHNNSPTTPAPSPTPGDNTGDNTGGNTGGDTTDPGTNPGGSTDAPSTPSPTTPTNPNGPVANPDSDFQPSKP